MPQEIEVERSEFKTLLLKNPNHFGTLAESDMAADAPMQGNTKYEELRCIGYHPQDDLLQVIFDVKLPFGYGGDLCGNGSQEYVRVYVDWDGDGDFDLPEEDIGMVSVNVHDIPNGSARCVKDDKPLSYAVRMRLRPKRFICDKPRLVKVRAVLSWSAMPMPNTPDYPMVWGNAIEKWIQIEPRPKRLRDLVKAIDLKKLQVDPELLQLDLPISKVKALSIAELAELYEGAEVPQHRYAVDEIAPIAAQIINQPQLLFELEKDPYYAGMLEAVKLFIFSKPETKYEELECLGLHYGRQTLAATLRVKLPKGYGGDLCKDGSMEHVAFWARVHDQIEQTCVWKYLGTRSVNVHDIEEITRAGLHYAVQLPVDFSPWTSSCKEPAVIRVRAVLSWSTPPSTTDPFEPPRWGNSIEANIQLKPQVDGEPGDHTPTIWSVGDMAVESIDGNVFTIIHSALGPGYANGPNIGGSFDAVNSPFGGRRTQITGSIANRPNRVSAKGGFKLKYKVQYKKDGSAGDWKDILQDFKIWLRFNDTPIGSVNQSPTGGYYEYYKDLKEPGVTEVQDDVLVIWDTKAAGGDGLYWLRILVHQPGAPAVGDVPADHVAGELIAVQVDNTVPKAKIDLDAGLCTKFEVGDKFEGKFTATDAHIREFKIFVLPQRPDMIEPKVSPASGVSAVSQTFTVITTKDTTPCGYVIRLWVRDRTIVNNTHAGNRNTDEVGLCLLEKKPVK